MMCYLNPRTIILTYLTIFNLSAFALVIKNSDIDDVNNEWNLRILHTNDAHGRFDEILNEETDCSNEDKIAKKCLGGFARIATLVREARKASDSVLYLDAGDVYQGTSWFTKYRWEIASKFMNILKPNATTLGNHEFDDGPQGLIPYLKNAQFPIVVCNINSTAESEMDKLHIKKSVTLDVNGHKVGIIGYVTGTTKDSSKPGNVIFSNEIECIQNEVQKLTNDGVNIIIGLGHSGYDADLEIAKKVEGLDMIVGGHSHTFLYSGEKPDKDDPAGPYPTIVNQKNGASVYVVQAYQYTKYLGDITFTFNSDGKITKFTGQPILLDNKVSQASDVVEELDKLRGGLNAVKNNDIGYSHVLLYHSWDCRTKECNFGNLVTDAMVEDNLNKFNGQGRWTDAAVALLGSGSILHSIDKHYTKLITRNDLTSAIPYDNRIAKITITGQQLLEILEHSVATLEHNVDNYIKSGQFLHFSGIKVVYNTKNSVGSRVVLNSVLVRCASCDIPFYEKLDLTKNYVILTTDYIASGGDGFTMLKTLNAELTGSTTWEAITNYIKQRNSVYTELEGRIQFVTSKGLSSTDFEP